MRATRIGEFEELVLLTVIVLEDDAYGVAIKRELESRLETTVSVGSVQSSLKRMEDKGFLTSEFGEATPQRGGRRKRLYQATPAGHRVLTQMRDIRIGFWTEIPSLSPTA